MCIPLSSSSQELSAGQVTHNRSECKNWSVPYHLHCLYQLLSALSAPATICTLPVNICYAVLCDPLRCVLPSTILCFAVLPCAVRYPLLCCALICATLCATMFYLVLSCVLPCAMFLYGLLCCVLSCVLSCVLAVRYVMHCLVLCLCAMSGDQRFRIRRQNPALSSSLGHTQNTARSSRRSVPDAKLDLN